MAIIGGAVFTPIMGYIAIDSMALAMLIPLVCYVYSAYFAFYGSQSHHQTEDTQVNLNTSH
jgi:FHS family L-fucose permease-like MFS transporter